MKLYLDTNVYDFICKSGETIAVRESLSAQRHAVLASATALVEMWAIPKYELRKPQVETLTAIANEFESLPNAYRQAREVLSEIQRQRPAWIRPPTRAEKRNTRALLSSGRELWKWARESPGETIGFDDYASAAATTDKDGQRRLRREMLQQGGLDSGLRLQVEGAAAEFGDNEELYWRHSALRHWAAALFNRLPAVGDLFDWLAPHLDLQTISMEEFGKFWIDEVDGARMPRSRVIGLAEYYQLKHRVSPGNAQDLNHSAYILDCDVFLTADRTFQLVLSDVRAWVGSGGAPVLVDRQRTSANEAICAALNDI